jgi:hypothetical protein
MEKMLAHPAYEGLFISEQDFVDYVKSFRTHTFAEIMDLTKDLFDFGATLVQPGYEYEGVEYHPYTETEDDNIKIYHEVSDGVDSRMMDWSPYSTPTVADFHLWVDLGMPGRVTNGPLNTQDLEKIAAERGVEA